MLLGADDRLNDLAGEDVDRALMRRVALGDGEALANLYDRHRRWMLTLAARIVGSAAEAEEIVQEALLELWRRAGQYAPERAAPVSWLATILRSRALDRRRTQEATARLKEAQHDPSPSEARSAEEVLGVHQELVRLRAALGCLTPEQRRCLELAWLEGLTHTQVSERTGMPIGSVKTRIRMALARLAEEL